MIYFIEPTKLFEKRHMMWVFFQLWIALAALKKPVSHRHAPHKGGYAKEMSKEFIEAEMET